MDSQNSTNINFKIKIPQMILAIIIFLIIVFFRPIVSLFADWLWFSSLNISSVFFYNLKNEIVLGFCAFVLTFIFLIISSKLTLKLYNKIPQVSVGGVIHLPSANKSGISAILYSLTFLISTFFAVKFSSNWQLFQKYINSVPFNIADPLFGKDVSFYIFKLPAIQYVLGMLSILVLVSLFIAGAVYFFSRGLDGIPKNFDLPFKTKIHLIILISLMFIIQAVSLWFSKYSIVNTPNNSWTGALYTDVNAILPYIYIYAVMFLIAACVVFFDLKSNCWKYTTIAATVLLLTPLLGNFAYPSLLQKFYVSPNELSVEAPFIERNINFTRSAFGLDKFDEQEYPASRNLTWNDIENNRVTLDNVRLWDYKPLLDSYAELQEIRTYYKFSDVDFDRYTIGDNYRQTMISLRELAVDRIPGRKWINETFIYTHGYGACLSPVNQVSSDGLPEFFIRDVPPVSTLDIENTRPEIYFGEITNSYVIVNSKVKEFDYPQGDDNVYCTYQGLGGVKIDSILKRVMFAAYFSELKILMSSEIVPQSRIMYNRNIAGIVSKIAPYLKWDSDPYPVISKGRIFWILDGYTTSKDYPYSQSFNSVNYVRNSVKATIDAYDGTVNFYICDSSDPVIACYSSMYKELFKPIDEMPEDLKLHIRYPEDLFKLQADVYAQYHMKDVQIFYNQEDKWKLPEDEEPYYTILKLPPPHGKIEEFVLMTPFTPARKSNMIAIMAARCDAPSYGKIIMYTLPKDKLIFGQSQINSRINQEPEIAKQLTLWSQGGSTVIRGSLLAIPIEDSILYIEPLYLASAKGKIPQLKQIFVVYGDKVAMEDTLEKALRKVFDASAEIPELTSKETIGENRSSVDVLKSLILDAAKHYDKANDYMKNGDWQGYGKEIDTLGKKLNELKSTAEEKI